MNCRQFQHDLDEYSEGSLSAQAQAAAEKHLAECMACRQRLQEEQEAARSLREGMRQATERLELPPEVGRRVLAALSREREHPPAHTQYPTSRERPSIVEWLTAAADGLLGTLQWRRLAWPTALATAALVAVAAWALLPRQPRAVPRPAPPQHAQRGISVQLSFVEPTYMFRRENGHVVDALTVCTKVVNERLTTDVDRLY